MRRYTRSLIGLVLLVLAACSQPTVTIVSVDFVSHKNGDVVTGSRQVQVLARVTAPDDATVAGEHNGQALAFTRQGRDLSATVTLADGTNVLEVEVSAAGKSDTATLALVYPFVSLEDGQAGAVVIGQLDATTASEEAPVTMRMTEPYTRPAFMDGMLFVPDSGTHRVLVFDGVPTTAGAEAAFVVGQPDFETLTPGLGAGGFTEPGAVVPYGDGFLVVDTQNSRVLVFDQVPGDFGASATRVLGQPDFAGRAPDCSATRFRTPDSATFAGDRFVLADTDNHRVLIWDRFPADADTPADVVLGQDGFDTCEPNAGDATPGADTLHTPQAVWSDGQRLIVADTGNHRVLVWNEVPTASNVPADVVIGQATFATADPGLAADAFNWPAYLDSNGNQLFVADADNHRVLVWDSIPTQNGQPADRVLGQPDFVSGAINQGKGVGPDTLNTPSGVHYLDGKLLVADLNNFRYVVFEASAD